jgi:hypothetical protein
VRQVGGGLYFLRELGGLASVYQQIALALRAEYTIGYYPVDGVSKPGWRSLRLELRPEAVASHQIPQGVRVTHRTAYYVPAVP